MSYPKKLIGLDVGGTKCALTFATVLKGERPEILKKVRFETVKGDPDAVLERFMTELDAVCAEFSIQYGDVSGIGISCGGPLDSVRGVVMGPPNLPGWDDVHICEYFEERTGIKCYLQNDANASAVAEWKYGAGRGYKDLVFLTFGTGLGAGLILDGRLYRGKSDNAGEVGHIRMAEDGPVGYGKRGSAEGFCSGGGIRQLGVEALREASPDSRLYIACEGSEENINAKLIGDLADEGDEVCLGIYKRSAEKLGSLLAMLCDILDPEVIIMGGIYMRSSHLYYDTLMEMITRESLSPCKILPAGLGESIGDLAALSVAEGEF